MSAKALKGLRRALGIVLCGGAVGLAAGGRPPAGAELSPAAREKVIRFIRERFGVADATQLSLNDVRDSFAPNFYEASLSANNGKNKNDRRVWFSKDSRYLFWGSLFEVAEPTNSELISRLRLTFKIPENIKLTLGSFHASHVADFEEAVLTSDNGKGTQETPVFLAKDGKHAIVGQLYSLDVDLQKKQALRIISLRGAPTQGATNAPVTIVEYADLQCPMCARLHDFFETQLLPRYGSRVRVVFKEFPLVGIHDWSPLAAVACQCAYEMNPSSYVPLRTAIFRSQQIINITNVRDLLLSYGEQAALDRVKLAACLDAKSSWPRVEADLAEGKRLEVASTPTSFINGRMMVGLPSAEDYYHAVDEALSAGK